MHTRLVERGDMADESCRLDMDVLMDVVQAATNGGTTADRGVRVYRTRKHKT